MDAIEQEITDKFAAAMVKIGVTVSVSYDSKYLTILIEVPNKEQADKVANLLLQTSEVFHLQKVDNRWLISVDVGPKSSPNSHS